MRNSFYRRDDSFKLLNFPVLAYVNIERILSEGVNNLSNLPEKPNAISEKVIDLLVDDTFRRNGINPENIKEKLTDQQKKQLKELVEDLTQQVNTFTDKPNKDMKNSK